jgi:dihydrofolate reductase
MISLIRHAGVSFRQVNLLERLEEVLIRQKNGLIARMNLLDRQMTFPKARFDSLRARMTRVIRVTASFKRRKNPVRARLIAFVPLKNPLIQRMDAFKAQTTTTLLMSTTRVHWRTPEAPMRRLKIMEHISLDGVIQSSRDDDDFPYSDWTAPYRTPAGRDEVLAAQGERFDLLLGRRTYDIWSGFWPTAPRSSMADRINAATKYVATHRPESLEWGPLEALGPDLVEGIRRIKSKGGPDLVLWGSSTLTSTVLEHGLAEEVVLIVYPLYLGAGKRFIAQGTPPRSFELVGTTATPSGVLFNSYRVRGPLKVPAE